MNEYSSLLSRVIFHSILCIVYNFDATKTYYYYYHHYRYYYYHYYHRRVKACSRVIKRSIGGKLLRNICPLQWVSHLKSIVSYLQVIDSGKWYWVSRTTLYQSPKQSSISASLCIAITRSTVGRSHRNARHMTVSFSVSVPLVRISLVFAYFNNIRHCCENVLRLFMNSPAFSATFRRRVLSSIAWTRILFVYDTFIVIRRSKFMRSLVRIAMKLILIEVRNW